MEGTSKNKIKILFLIPTLEMGGAEIQLLELVKNLNKAIFDITVGVFYANGRLSADFLDIPEIDVRFFGTKNKIGFSRVRNLVAFLKSHSVDIIEMWNISTKTIGILIAKIFTISNTIVRERTADYIFSGFGSVLYTFTDRLSATKAKMVIANSEAGRNFAIRKGIQPQRIQVIYNSLSSSKMRADKEPEQLRYELGLQKNQPIIGMIARLIRQKDPISFLRAAQIVLKSHSNASFLVVGNGPLYQELYKKAKTFGIDKKVLFTGERRDVPDLLNLIDIVVLPSNLTEGCSNAVMEAMYMGKPVIATNIGGNPELIEDGRTGFLVPPKCPQELAAKINTLLEDRETLKKVGEQARTRAIQLFSASNNTRKNEFIYKELVSDRDYKTIP